MEPAKRKYPVGIQSFECIRTDGYVYVPFCADVVAGDLSAKGRAFSRDERNIMEWKSQEA